MAIDLSTLDGADGFRLDGTDTFDLAGRAVANAGDVNGDGFSDFLIGAFGGDPGGQSDAGETHVVFGKSGGFASSIDLADLNGSDGFRIDGNSSYDYSGDAVASAGDLNGDGFDDLIVGARGGGAEGKSYVIFGQATFGSTIDVATMGNDVGVTITGAANGDQSGFDVSGAGDFNGDGFADLLIGAAYADLDSSGSRAGQTTILFGSANGFSSDKDLASLDASEGLNINGADTGHFSGRSVAGAGDINGDGLSDIIIGAPYADLDAGRDAGAAFVVFGVEDNQSLTLDLDALDGADGFQLAGLHKSALTGMSVAGLGDVNGDGFADFGIGASGGDSSNRDANGVTFVIFGKEAPFDASIDLAALDGGDGFRIHGDDSFDRSGTAIATAGDFNGDGYSDIIIGAPTAAPDGKGGAGESYIVFGASSFDSDVELDQIDGNGGLRLDGIDASDASGQAVSGAGDVDGDGYDDVIIGASVANPGGGFASGEAYLVRGSDVEGLVTHSGDDGENSVIGNGQNNLLILGQGNDTFNAGNGDDVLRGGDGRDQGTMSGGNDRAFGGAGDDVIRGGSGNDMLDGGDGNDRLLMELGDDIVFGGAGDDLIFERANHLKAGDRIHGGEGDGDTLIVQSAGALDLTLLDAFTGIERVKVAAGQIITATDDSIQWTGRSGAETYNLGAGDDVVKAGGGNDIINGGAGDDVLIAHDGDDRLSGGTGNDQLLGSTGNDTFVFGPGGGVDTVFDFTNGVDLIDVSGYGYNSFVNNIAPRIDTVNGSAVIDFASGDRAILKGVSASDLDAADFIL